MAAFALSCALVTLLVGAWVARRHGTRFAIPAVVALTVQGAIAIGAYRIAGPMAPALFYFQATVYAMVAALAYGRVPFEGWRVLVSWPASWFVVASFLALPWSIFGIQALAWLPFVIAVFGLGWSASSRRETVTVDLSVPLPPGLDRVPKMIRRRPGLSRPGHPGLRLVQITDPHLGPFMSEARLRAICERAVAAEPDLIVLTGDYFTRETHRDAAMLARALAPLARHPFVYAVRGNHDLESPETVAEGLAAAKVRLLIDEAVTIETRVGPVQVVGLDFHWRNRARTMRGVFVDLVRPNPGLRIVLLHDPGAFRELPQASADLVLSGHTHGGHVGLVAFGLDWTAVRALTGLPDHGPWAHGNNRLYVHRANGHYGFPLRVGVPAEESVLELVGGR